MWNSYNIATFIVNIFIALGTCGAVILALLNSIRPKEKANGIVEFVFNANPPFVKFEIVNKHKTDFVFNYQAGLLLKTTTDNEIISLNNTDNNEIFIPANAKRSFRYNLKLRGEPIIELLKDKTCRVFVYTMLGTQIELKLDGAYK